ncbi:hypothetical protein [Microvirga lotononidis]|uniref:hypothetical protein n=1 Tax=Microvirga lotononidis TaxID=864069 RepID=UPI001FD9E6DC|nr:hypothetical protein [Microvirga lotononidis]WQO27865.1 hypothetical protein U0023_01770 [Microvirga lotononidis]
MLRLVERLQFASLRSKNGDPLTQVLIGDAHLAVPRAVFLLKRSVLEIAVHLSICLGGL